MPMRIGQTRGLGGSDGSDGSVGSTFLKTSCFASYTHGRFPLVGEPRGVRFGFLSRLSVRGSQCSGSRAGFTLLEILIAISVLVIVVGIVYECLEAVTNATETARLQETELRARDFLLRNFSSSLSSLYVDPGFQNPQCQLVGKKGTGGIDSLEFCSSAPLMGGASEPGLLKRVTYGEAEDKPAEGQGAFAAETDDRSSLLFEARERLIREPSERVVFASSGALERQLRSVMSSDDLIEPSGGVTPTWTLPVEAVSFLYFDGKDWLEEWDSMGMMRLPWCIRIRVNFARSPDEEADGGPRALTVEDEGDFQMYVPIPMASGVHTDAATWLQILQGTSAGGVWGAGPGLLPATGTGVLPSTTASQNANTANNARENR